jgi:hypothetical protein
LYRPDTQNCLPSGETDPMSGEPPPGIVQVATTVSVAKSITDTDPPSRLVAYSCVPSRDG